MRRTDIRPLGCACNGKHLKEVFSYTAPPNGEVRFRFSTGKRYLRQVLRCEVCGHFVSVHDMDAGPLYTGEYVTSNYSDLEGIRKSFSRVVTLPASQSDNAGRVRRVIEYASRHLPATGSRSTPTVLDIGSGLAVFVHGLKAAGWDCTALDPDSRAVDHARGTVGVKTVCGDFMKADLQGTFDVVSFNRVLEHVEDPVAMLRRSATLLKPNGFVYMEVPDGETAAKHGQDRQEFYIDHPNIFSAVSLAMMIDRSGLQLLRMERLHEPSDKYTLLAFAGPPLGGPGAHLR